jgi:hypothetical protein
MHFRSAFYNSLLATTIVGSTTVCITMICRASDAMDANDPLEVASLRARSCSVHPAPHMSTPLSLTVVQPKGCGQGIKTAGQTRIEDKRG